VVEATSEEELMQRIKLNFEDENLRRVNLWVLEEVISHFKSIGEA